MVVRACFNALANVDPSPPVANLKIRDCGEDDGVIHRFRRFQEGILRGWWEGTDAREEEDLRFQNLRFEISDFRFQISDFRFEISGFQNLRFQDFRI